MFFHFISEFISESFISEILMLFLQQQISEIHSEKTDFIKRFLL